MEKPDSLVDKKGRFEKFILIKIKVQFQCLLLLKIHTQTFPEKINECKETYANAYI